MNFSVMPFYCFGLIFIDVLYSLKSGPFYSIFCYLIITNQLRLLPKLLFLLTLSLLLLGLLLRHCRRFETGGVPRPTSEMSPRAPAQMGRRETEREGGKKAAGARERWKSRGLRACPAPRSGALAVGGYKRPRGRGASGLTRAPVPSSSMRGQPSVRGPWSFLL
jgi:hypothetical protein